MVQNLSDLGLGKNDTMETIVANQVEYMIEHWKKERIIQNHSK